MVVPKAVEFSSSSMSDDASSDVDDAGGAGLSYGDIWATRPSFELLRKRSDSLSLSSYSS